MRRVAIIGPGGAGKTTLALALGQALGIEVLHLDKLYWKPGWVEPLPDEWDAVQREAMAGDEWIADGASEGTPWLGEADTIIFLDLPLLFCLSRVIRRRLFSGDRPRMDAAVDCVPARFDRAFVKYLRSSRHYRRVTRPRIRAYLGQHATERRVVILRRRSEVRSFAARVRTEEQRALAALSGPLEA